MNENHISCTICKGASFGEFTFKNLTLCRCTHCGHRFTRHDSLENPKEYDEEYYLSEHKNWFNNPNIELFDKVYSLINQKPQQDFSVLDVGCGKCDLLKYFKSKSNSLKLYGIDLSPNEPQEGIEFIKGDFLSTIISSRFDLIVSLAVIEHIIDIHAFTARLKELCKPGGLVVVMTMNDDSSTYRIARIMYRLGLKKPLERLYDKHHVNHFSMDSLRDLLERNGLEILEVFKHNIPLSAIDVPASSRLKGLVMKAGVLTTFAMNNVMGSTFLQTVICRRPEGQIN